MLNKIEEAILDIESGKMVIVVDDENRENEGDLIMAAEKVTADDITFMANFGKGLGLRSSIWSNCQKIST